MRLAFDIGGTFTDVVLIKDDGDVVPLKTLSLIAALGPEMTAFVDQNRDGEITHFVHGTTIASNMVIEGNTARTGFLTTKGFRDTLDMRRLRRPNVYDMNWERPRVIIPGEFTRVIPERILASGEETEPLDKDEARRVLLELREKGVEAIAISFLNSYVDGTHEQQAREVANEVLPGLPVCLSSELNPEIGEYERGSTTAINASLMPGVRAYLDQLDASIRHLSPHLTVMRSNGGIMTSEMAREFPAAMIESGPAAGVLASAYLARETNIARVLTFDMGGTTAKASFVADGIPLEKPGGEIGEQGVAAAHGVAAGAHAVRVPCLDIAEVGAGGGSLAWIDETGALRVGPRSAGANPGPVCYGLGGENPTVTDANCVLGYMYRDAIADATLKIDYESAYRAIDEKIATPLGLSVLDAAHGICQVANATMMRALRAVSTEKGQDPRGCSLIAFGGAGPMHAAELANLLGITRVCVPLYPGLFSAVGLLFANFRNDYVRTVVRRVGDLTSAEISEMFTTMEQTASVAMTEEGVPAENVSFERHAELRYAGQAVVMPTELPPDLNPAEIVQALSELFVKGHVDLFGYEADAPIELISLRLRAIGRRPNATFRELASAVSGKVPAARTKRKAYFGKNLGELECTITNRWAIEGSEEGPMIIEEPDTTVVVPPSWQIERDQLGTLILSRIS